MDTTPAPAVPYRPDPDQIRKALAKRSFCGLATVSPAGRPHVAGVLYELVGDAMYTHTQASSRKARNIAHNRHAAVMVPVRRVPAGGPPSSIQFQTTAAVLALDDPEIDRHLHSGKLASITGHGELEMADGCFVRVDLPSRLHTYGLGMPLRTLVRDPLGAGGEVLLSS